MARAGCFGETVTSRSRATRGGCCLNVDKAGCGGPPYPAAGPGSWTGPLRQEIPLNVQLADPPLEPGNKGLIALMASLQIEYWFTKTPDCFMSYIGGCIE